MWNLSNTPPQVIEARVLTRLPDSFRRKRRTEWCDANKPGHEIEYPMAVVILGGLITSTVLNLFLLPPLYAAYGRIARHADA